MLEIWSEQGFLLVTIGWRTLKLLTHMQEEGMASAATNSQRGQIALLSSSPALEFSID